MGTLTATKIKALKPKEKIYRESDGDGLFIQVNPNGSKWWRFRYRFDNKQKMISVGTYPDVTLADARKKIAILRNQVANEIDPSAQRRSAKTATRKEELKDQHKIEFSFENLSRAILQERLDKKAISEPHWKRTQVSLENDAYPLIGDMEVKDIKPNDVKRVIKHVTSRGADESARKLFYAIGKIFKTLVTRNDPEDANFDYGVEYSPTVSIDIEDLTGKKNIKHYPCITDKKSLKGLLQSIDAYSGNYTTKMAMKLLPHIFLRSFNIRHLEWSEVDFEDKYIRISAEKMKTKNDFIIPMSQQVFEILEEVQQFTGTGQYVFSSLIHKDRPMSDNTMISALRRMGYTKEEFVPHSWRSVFATIANENGKHFEAIETSLAHSVGSGVSRAYNRAQYLEQRKELYQWWSDWLDDVKS